MAARPRDRRLRTLSLCAGIGGIDLGLADWSRTVCYVEREAFSAAVLVARMEEASLDRAIVWDDLSTFDGRPWRGRVDLVTGGYPCQPFSLAGARKGADDPRHLWPHVRRIVEEVAPPLVFLENVSGHVSLGLEDVVRDLEGMGYRVAAMLLGAADVGATHKRERLWILGYAERARRPETGSGPDLDAGPEPVEGGGSLAHPDLRRRQGVRSGGLPDGGQETRGDDADGRGGRSAREVVVDASRGGAPAAQLKGLEYQPVKTDAAVGDPQCSGRNRLYERLESGHMASDAGITGAGLQGGTPPWPPGPEDVAVWAELPEAAQPAIRRMADGLPAELVAAGIYRQDRLRALGNAVVPACAAAAFRILLTQLFP